MTLDESLQETIPALLFILDALPKDSPFLQLDPPQRRRRILDTLKLILLRESQVQPLLLVFEDLHWIDSETQALLDSLIESLPTAQLLLLCNYRPEYQHAWGSKTFYTQLRLDPLRPESVDALIEALLGNDSSLEPLKKLLIERTEGNPFFLEESVRTLVETQVLAGAPGAYRLAQALPTIQVPATVQAVLAARIDRLPTEEKRLLQTAESSAAKYLCPCYRPLPSCPKRHYIGASHISKRRNSCMKQASIPNVSTPSNMHIRMRSPTAVSFRGNDVCSMPELWRVLKHSLVTAGLSRSSDWHTMPCGVRYGRRP